MPKRVEFEGVVHEFPDDFTDAEIASALGGDQPAQGKASMPATPGVAAGVGAAAIAPGILAGVNTTVNAVARNPIVKRVVPAIAAYKAYEHVTEGKYWDAAKDTAATVAPAALKAVGNATGPVGPAAAGASVLSRFAGMASLPFMIASSLSDSLRFGESQASKLDDPNVTAREKDEILRQLHSAGGF